MSPAAELRRVVTVLVAGVALAACGGRPAAPSPGAPTPTDTGVTGLHWRLERVAGPGGATRLPATVRAWLELDGRGHASGSDGCATFRATGHLSATTLRLTGVSATANGCVADHGPLDAARVAVARVLLSGHPAAVIRTAHRLELHGVREALTYVNAGPSAPG